MTANKGIFDLKHSIKLEHCMVHFRRIVLLIYVSFERAFKIKTWFNID